MKSIILTLALFVTMFGFAQHKKGAVKTDKQIEKAETPKIISLLKAGGKIKEDNIQVKFLEVVEDSRCPKDVQCMWAGEVKVKVEVTNYNASKPQPEERVLVLSPTADFDDLFGNIFHADGFNITAVNVKPYPISTKKIKPKEYALQFYVQR